MITRIRYEGFIEAFKRAGKKPDESLIFLNIGNEHRLGEIVKQLSAKHVDGVICMDDQLAGSVMAVCRAERIRIPEELRLASFYNSSILENAAVPVTSLNFDDRNLGAVAARMLLSLIDGDKVEKQKLKNYEVIMKESTK
jgi:DNA-binding LacI/PurR family transcriptional regulator